MKKKKNIPLLIEIIYLLIIFSKNNIYTIVYAVWEKNVFTTTEFIEWVACLGVSWTVKITEYVFFFKNKNKEKGILSFKDLFYMDLGVLDVEQFEVEFYNVDHGEQSKVVG